VALIVECSSLTINILKENMNITIALFVVAVIFGAFSAFKKGSKK